jgi:hypothetical protein
MLLEYNLVSQLDVLLPDCVSQIDRALIVFAPRFGRVRPELK